MLNQNFISPLKHPCQAVFAALKESGRVETFFWGGCVTIHMLQTAISCFKLPLPSVASGATLGWKEQKLQVSSTLLSCVRSRHLHVMASRWCSLAYWAAAGRHLSLLLHPAAPSQLSLYVLVQPQLLNGVWVCQLPVLHTGPGWETCSAVWKAAGRFTLLCFIIGTTTSKLILCSSLRQPVHVWPSQNVQ